LTFFIFFLWDSIFDGGGGRSPMGREGRVPSLKEGGKKKRNVFRGEGGGGMSVAILQVKYTLYLISIFIYMWLLNESARGNRGGGKKGGKKKNGEVLDALDHVSTLNDAIDMFSFCT